MFNYKKIVLAMLSIMLPVIGSAGFFSNPYNHYYVTVGAGGYYVQQPKFHIGTKGETLANYTSTLAKMNINRATPAMELGFGYWFMNCPQNWLSKLFGHEEAIEGRLSYHQLDATEKKANLGLGNIWYIDGSRAVPNTGLPIPLYDFKLTSQMRSIGTGIYLKGKVYTSQKWLYMDRYVGLVYNYYHNEYDYTVDYDQGGGNRATDDETFKVNTHYFGPAFGSRLNFKVTPYITPFADLEVRLLMLHASLQAHQDTGQNISLSVNNSESKFNYEAIAALGVQYKFTRSLKSPSLTLRGGVDHWNWVPRVVTPNHAGDQAVHLHGESVNNGFVMLSLEVPFG